METANITEVNDNNNNRTKTHLIYYTNVIIDKRLFLNTTLLVVNAINIS